MDIEKLTPETTVSLVRAVDGWVAEVTTSFEPLEPDARYPEPGRHADAEGRAVFVVDGTYTVTPVSEGEKP